VSGKTGEEGVGRTITEPSPDGQNDNDYNRDRLILGGANYTVITKFEKEQRLDPRIVVIPNCINQISWDI